MLKECNFSTNVFASSLSKYRYLAIGDYVTIDELALQSQPSIAYLRYNATQKNFREFDEIILL